MTSDQCTPFSSTAVSSHLCLMLELRVPLAARLDPITRKTGQHRPASQTASKIPRYERQARTSSNSGAGMQARRQFSGRLSKNESTTSRRAGQSRVLHTQREREKRKEKREKRKEKREKRKEKESEPEKGGSRKTLEVH